MVSGIPTGIIGFAGKQFFKALFGEPFIVSLLIIVTGIFLFIASQPKDQKEEVRLKSALWIGAAQGIAVAPGISRSGATIGTALLLGIKPRDAAEFSFLIGIPAMTIASALTFLEEPAAGTGFGPLLVATIAAFIAGYASIGLFMKWLHEREALLFFPLLCDCREYLCGVTVQYGILKPDWEERSGAGSDTASRVFRVSPCSRQTKKSPEPDPGEMVIKKTALERIPLIFLSGCRNCEGDPLPPQGGGSLKGASPHDPSSGWIFLLRCEDESQPCSTGRAPTRR